MPETKAFNLEITESIDFKYFDRFDANTGMLQAKIGTTGISVTGPIEAGEKYAIFLNKAGNIMAMRPDPAGFEIRTIGRGKRMICIPVINAMKKRDVIFPQTTDLVQQDDAYIARLKTAKQEDADEKPRGRKGMHTL